MTIPLGYNCNLTPSSTTDIGAVVARQCTIESGKNKRGFQADYKWLISANWLRNLEPLEWNFHGNPV